MITLKILILILPMIQTSCEFSVSTVVSITASVLHHYRSTCVYFLQFSDQQDMKNLLFLHLLKEMIRDKYVALSVMGLEKFKYPEQPMQCQPLYVAFSSPDTRKRLSKSAVEMKLSLRRWLIFMVDEESLADFFAGIYIPLDCDLLVAQHLGSQLEVSLTEVFHVHHMHPLKEVLVGNWSSDMGLNWTRVPLHSRRGNLDAAIVQVGVVPRDRLFVTRNTLGEIKHNAIDKSGYMFEIWKEMQRLLNFRSHYHIAQEQGALDHNGSWNGVVRLLLNGSVEVGLNEFLYSRTMLDVVNYLFPFKTIKLSVYIKQHENNEAQWDYILAPFSNWVWSFTVVSLLVLTLALTLAWSLGYKYGHDLETNDYNLYNSWLCILGDFCLQGHEFSPRSWSCRLVHLTAYIMSLVLFMAYSGTFISFLTVQRTPMPFTDFRGLLEDGTYRLGVIAGSPELNLFDKSRDPSRMEIYTKLIRPHLELLPQNLEEGLERVCHQKNYAFLMSPLTVRLLGDLVPCSLAEVQDAYFPVPISMIISKNSSYRKILNYNVQRIRQTGILNRIESSYLYSGMEEEAKHPTLSVMPVIMIMVVGVAVAMLCLLCEIVSGTFRPTIVDTMIPFVQ